MAISSELWGAIVGGLFAFGVTISATMIQGRQSARLAKIQLDHDDKKEEDSLRTKNLEELFVAVKHWIDRIFMDDLNYRKVMDGVLTYDQALDLVIKWGSEQNYDFKRIEMMIAFHFPNLQPAHNGIMKIQDQIQDVISSFRKQYVAGVTTSKEHSQQLGSLIDEFLAKCRILENEIVRLTT
jgi:hypothetical protein